MLPLKPPGFENPKFNPEMDLKIFFARAKSLIYISLGSTRRYKVADIPLTVRVLADFEKFIFFFFIFFRHIFDFFQGRVVVGGPAGGGLAGLSSQRLYPPSVVIGRLARSA